MISLFGISASLITASYLSFEKNQRIRGAAVQLKSDLRLVQNDATSGNKDVQGTVCSPTPPLPPTPPILGGWYLSVNSTSGSNTSYIIGGDCITASGEVVFPGKKAISLPKDITISNITYDTFANPGSLGFFFRPLGSGMTVHNDSAFSGSLDFYKDNGSLNNCYSLGCPQSPVTITLANSSGKTAQVKIESTGEVNEIIP